MNFKKEEMLIIVHFGELWLKGKNRNAYIQRLKRNILEALRNEVVQLENHYDRFVLRLDDNSDMEGIKEGLSHVFGINSYEVAYATNPEISSINKLAKKMLSENSGKNSVKLDAHRSYKMHGFNSLDILRELNKIAKDLGYRVANHGFEDELHVNVTRYSAFLYRKRIKALGGLPVGTSGKAVVLLSGGIDSPVAAWYAMKRGIEPVYVHVHACASDEEVLSSKIPKILELLSRYSRHYKVYYVPSYIFQVHSARAGRYELILLKLFMMTLAERIAKIENAGLIFTGESLGQVASQTPSNLMAESRGIRLPILRPLIGLDKEEIIRMAKGIGTYEYSIMQYRDVCSINSRNPKTRTTTEKIDELKKEIGIGRIVTRSLRLSKAIEV